MKDYRLYIFDLDGTLYRGGEPVPNSVASVNDLAKQAKIIRYLTNNSSLTGEQQAEKLQNMGFPTQANEVYSSANGAAAHAKNRGCQKVYVVGEPGLAITVEKAGLKVVNFIDGAIHAKCEEQTEAVICGICWTFSYEHLTYAMRQILGGAEFIATNTDATYPMARDEILPGSGTIVAAVEKATGKTPYVTGKPNPALIELIVREAGVKPEETLVVGDRVDTDLKGGEEAGCDTHLVLTGITKTPPEGQPYSQDLTALLKTD